MSRPPNILLILSDQHNPHAAGFAGSAHVDTPSLDKLAQSGVVFDAAYCQSPLCVPSRISLWTGQYPHRCSAWDNRSMIDPARPTLPGWLAQNGYVTAGVGKMHFRGEEQMHGFQHRPYGDLVDTPVLIHQPDPPDTVDGRAESHAAGRFPFAGVSAVPESLHLDTVVTTESLAWLLDFADEHPDQPWFFCASYYRPHFPLTAPGRFIRKYQRRDVPLPPLPSNFPDELHAHDRYIVDDFNLLRFSDDERRAALRAYYGLVDYVDQLIGRLLDGLRAAGLLDNTLVVYTADHGEMAGEHGLWWKRTYYDASAGVPLIVSGPGISGGKHITMPVELVDLFPTFCEWARVEPPPGLAGESLLPLLRGEARRKRCAISELLGEKPQNRFRMVRDERWKYVEFPISPPRLFDLLNDPGERRNLWAVPPEDAPIPLLQAVVRSGGSWDELDHIRETEYQKREPFRRLSRSAAHYRLRDGRVIEADDHLYDMSNVLG